MCGFDFLKDGPRTMHAIEAKDRALAVVKRPQVRSVLYWAAKLQVRVTALQLTVAKPKSKGPKLSSSRVVSGREKRRWVRGKA